MKIVVTQMKVKDIARLIKELRKKYKNVNLKSRGTPQGRQTYIVYY